MQDPLLLTDEVADRMRVTPGTLKIWRHRGLGPPFYRYGRRVVYRASEVEQWITAHRSEASA
jgi:DNA-binding transcriptional MerR regulator